MNNHVSQENVIYILKVKRSIIVNEKEIFYDETVAECTSPESAKKMLEDHPDGFIEIHAIKK